MRNVNRPPRGNRYCGPAAISALTGVTTDEAALMLRHVSGRRAIKGCRKEHVIEALRMLGLTVTRVYIRKNGDPCPTVKQWARRRTGFVKPRNTDLLVGVTGHFIAVRNTRYWDSMNHEGCRLVDGPNKRVKYAYKVEGRVDRFELVRLLLERSAAARANQSNRLRAVAMARLLGVDLQSDSGGAEMSAPRGRQFNSIGCHFIEYYRGDYDTASEMWSAVVTDLEHGVDECPPGCDYCADNRGA
jgi:hypothetical protein